MASAVIPKQTPIIRLASQLNPKSLKATVPNNNDVIIVKAVIVRASRSSLKSIFQDISKPAKNIRVNKLISDNIKLLSDMALKKKISVFFEPEEEIEIYADFNMLNFVIRNLLTNALKFTPQQGEIRFSVENKKKKTVFCIEDTGIGMNTEQLNALFKVGQTYSGKGTENETGTGLGLILCKDFIDFHKGKIRVQSELGKGSTVCVELPKK